MSRRTVWWAVTARAMTARAALALALSACPSARQEPKSDAERSREPAQQVGDRVQSSVLQVRERAAAGELRAADTAALNGSFADNLEHTAPPAVPRAAAIPGTRTTPSSPRALGSSDAVRFGRLKAAIERANAEVERHRPRSHTERGSNPRL
jgi:hypothetical protein